MAIVACEYCTADEGVESLLCFERDLIGRNVGNSFRPKWWFRGLLEFQTQYFRLSA
jgi:hypothetical protein